MELQETEKKQYIDMIETLNYEKIALDSAYVVALKEGLNLRKELLLKEKVINDLNEQIQHLLKKNEVPILNPVIEEVI